MIISLLWCRLIGIITPKLDFTLPVTIPHFLLPVSILDNQDNNEILCCNKRLLTESQWLTVITGPSKTVIVGEVSTDISDKLGLLTNIPESPPKLI